MIVQLSRGQLLVLQAAAQVDYLSFRAQRQTNLRHGTWRSLVIRGYLRPVPSGWEITPEGRRLLTSCNLMLVDKQNHGGALVNGKLPRYCVARLPNGWAVIDRNLSSQTEKREDVVELMPSRHAARMKAGQLNLMEGTKDAAAAG